MEETQGSQASSPSLTRSAFICSLIQALNVSKDPPWAGPGETKSEGRPGVPLRKLGVWQLSKKSALGEALGILEHVACVALAGSSREDSFLKEGTPDWDQVGAKCYTSETQRQTLVNVVLSLGCFWNPGVGGLLSTFISGPTSRSCGFSSLQWGLGICVFYKCHLFLLR